MSPSMETDVQSPTSASALIMPAATRSETYGVLTPRRPTPSPSRRSDLEMAQAPGAVVDPYNFNERLKSDEELEALRVQKKGKPLEKYYRKQNDFIRFMLKSMEDHTDEAKAEEEANRLPIKIAIWASLIANFVLTILQLYAAISSLSLSLLATGIDSVFDISSNVILVWLHVKANNLDTRKWPVGGARLETIGNIIYGFLMSSVNLVVVVESFQSIITQETEKDFHIPSVVAVGAALGVKFLLFLYCHGYRKVSSQVHVLWEDHRNDLYINGFGLLTSILGSKLLWYIDPLGAIIIALGVIISWGRTVHQQFELLAGKSAPHDFIQLVIYKATTFCDEIEKIDTVRAYHSGPDYFVEVDVVMDANTPLWMAHDISQQLQDKIEVLPGVDRAFVHVDHEATHAPEHRKLI